MFLNWDDLKNFLKDLYQDSKHHSQLIYELINCKQAPNEPVNKFTCRIESALKRCINSTNSSTSDQIKLAGKIEMLQEIALNRLVYFSSPNISQSLRMKEPKNLNEAITSALTEERINNMCNNKRLYCSTCKTNTHNTINCRNQKRSVNVASSTNIQKSSPNSKEIKCCKYCKKIGHNIEECRKRQFNNNRNQSGYNNHQNPNNFQKNQLNTPVKVALLEDPQMATDI